MKVDEILDKQFSDNNESLKRREQTMFLGLLSCLVSTFAEYLNPEQISLLAENFKRARMRASGSEIDMSHFDVVSTEREIKNSLVPSKCLRRDEAALALYNLLPYSILNRKDSARLVKLSFPNFFGSVSTINTLFTKLSGLSGYKSNLSIVEISDHSVMGVETFLYELGETKINQN